MNTFTGKEPWLSIPHDSLRWEDLPSSEHERGQAIVVLALRAMPYAEYLRTFHWRDVRKQALSRYIGQCLCGQDAREVHHVTYDHKGFEYPQDVVALCAKCHQIWHDTWRLQARESINKIDV